MKLIFIVIIIIFFICPYIINQIFTGNIDKGIWIGFLGSYLGGGITALITLFGIYWQFQEMKKTEIKNKNEGLLKLITYKVNRNISKKFPYEILGQDEYYKNEEEFYFEGFKENLTIENEKLILTLKNGKEILEVIENIDNYNKLFSKYIFNNKKIEERVNDIDKLISQNKLRKDDAIICTRIILSFRNILKTLYGYDTLLYSFINGFDKNIFLKRKETLEKFEKVIIENLVDMVNNVNHICKTEIMHKEEIIRISKKTLAYREEMFIIEYEIFLKNFFIIESVLVYMIMTFSLGIGLEDKASKLLTKDLNEYSENIKMRETLLDKKNEIILKSKEVVKILEFLIGELE